MSDIQAVKEIEEILGIKIQPPKNTTNKVEYDELVGDLEFAGVKAEYSVQLTDEAVEDSEEFYCSYNGSYLSNENNEITSLTISGCSIENLNLIIPQLKEIKKLEQLKLCHNNLRIISSVSSLLNLIELDCSYNKISDVSPLKELTNLRKLDLRCNEISDISYLYDLENLYMLRLNGNKISIIPELKGLKSLSELSLCNNEIRSISPLKDLVGLKSLELRDNYVDDIKPLGGLVQLQKLNLYANEIIDISPLKNLSRLESLDFSHNDVREINPLAQLINLVDLSFMCNFIADLSPLRKLTRIENLSLWGNQISSLGGIKGLKGLKRLYIGENPIKRLPEWITDFDLEIVWRNTSTENNGQMAFYNTPLKSPPVEIVKQGKDAIKSYFEQIKQQGKDKIYEAKLMLVGEPGTGKTTLLNLLFDRSFPVPNDKQMSTLGIEVRQNWCFNVNEQDSFKAHVWDFGGQQIQYMLHQFFLTSDCVYVLMAEKRKELSNFDYWLNIINVFCPNSSVVTLFNEINIDFSSSFIYDEKKFKSFFPDLNLHKFDINLANIDDGRFDVFLNKVKKELGSLEHIGKEVPARWVDIRTKLEEQRSQKHIHINEYFDICRKFGIQSEEDQMLILRYFHLLGIVLHFSEDENLCDTLFLDPNWTVDAVYSILADTKIENSNGFVLKHDIDNIWNLKGYDYDERAKLLQLMLKDNFELCFKIPNEQNRYIVPLLLSSQKSEYEWDNSQNLQFRFQYPFMPKGIVSRLIVRMHEYIENNIVWKEGVVLRKGNAWAQIIELKTIKEGLKIIEIRLKGLPNSRKDFLTLIREEVKKIQDGSFPNLPYSEMVPCCCKECTLSATPYFFEYNDIENYLNKGKTVIDCRRSTDEVALSELIGSVFNIKEIEERHRKVMEQSKVNINIRDIGNSQQHVNQHVEQVSNQQQTVSQTVRNVTGYFKNLKEDILDEVDLEIEDEKEKKRIKKDLEKTEQAFEDIEKAVSEGSKEIEPAVKSRIEEFVDNLSDGKSRLAKALSLVSKGWEKVQKLGDCYNKVAPYLSLPSIPSMLVGKEQSE